MYTLINGSGKLNFSNSFFFLELISNNLNNYSYFDLKRDDYDEILEDIKKSDVIIFAFPLYIDSPTSLTLEFLDYIIDRKIKLDDKLVYVIINCGFRDGRQNITAINIVKRWCLKVGTIYGSSIMIGAGEVVGKDKFRFISKRALKDIKRFAEVVEFKQKEDDIITTVDLLNDKLYSFLANLSWRKKGRKNNLTNIDLKAK